jgi:hypothetical protein
MKLRHRSEGMNYDPRVARMLDRHVREQRGAAAVSFQKTTLRKRLKSAA